MFLRSNHTQEQPLSVTLSCTHCCNQLCTHCCNQSPPIAPSQMCNHITAISLSARFIAIPIAVDQTASRSRGSQFARWKSVHQNLLVWTSYWCRAFIHTPGTFSMIIWCAPESRGTFQLIPWPLKAPSNGSCRWLITLQNGLLDFAMGRVGTVSVRVLSDTFSVDSKITEREKSWWQANYDSLARLAINRHSLELSGSRISTAVVSSRKYFGTRVDPIG